MKSRGSVGLELQGMKELQRLFDELPKRVRKKGMRKAIGKAAQPITKDAKKGAKKHNRTGLLGRAVSQKVKTYPDGNVIAVIGVDKSIVGDVAELKAKDDAKKRGNVRIQKLATTTTGKIVPANYFHLVHDGHQGGAEGDPFLTDAYERHGPRAGAAAIAILQQVADAEAEKLRVK